MLSVYSFYILLIFSSYDNKIQQFLPIFKEMKKYPLFDVIISGAGPGGLTAAIHCAKAGLNIALVEKRPFPVSKACGDGFTTPVLTELRLISTSLLSCFVNKASNAKISSIRFYSQQNTHLQKQLKSPIYTCKRETFHSLLHKELNQHSYHLFENKEIASVNASPDGITCILKGGEILRSKLIIGADGVGSTVRKNLHSAEESNTSICLRTYYENVDFPEDTIGLFANINMPTSGIWLFPLGNGVVNIGFGLHQKQQQKKDIHLIQEFETQLQQFPDLRKALANARKMANYKGGQISIFNGEKPISGDRYFLVGDAASLADPLNGEGIGYAMASARYAAEETIRCIQHNQFDARQNKTYDKKVYRRIAKWNRKSLQFLWLWSRFPWIFSFVGFLNKIPVLQKLFQRLV